jgi:hypothetical protein
MMCPSSNGWTKVRPSASAIPWAIAPASSTPSPSSSTRAPSRRVFSTFMNGVKVGITIVAGMPSRRAWWATPWAWLPADMAITPRPRASSGSRESLL